MRPGQAPCFPGSCSGGEGEPVPIEGLPSNGLTDGQAIKPGSHLREGPRQDGLQEGWFRLHVHGAHRGAFPRGDGGGADVLGWLRLSECLHALLHGAPAQQVFHQGSKGAALEERPPQLVIAAEQDGVGISTGRRRLVRHRQKS